MEGEGCGNRLFCRIPVKHGSFLHEKSLAINTWHPNGTFGWLGKWQPARILIKAEDVSQEEQHLFDILIYSTMMKVSKAQQRSVSCLCQLHICLALVISRGWEDLYLVWLVIGITYFVMVESSDSRTILKAKLF